METKMVLNRSSWHGFPTRGLFGHAGPTGPGVKRRRGFSFTEILFAVMVLGIGFIMIAAIFPVAIKQTKATSEETNASTIAKGGVDYFEKIASDPTAPPVMPATTATPGPGTVVYQDGPTGGGTTRFWSALQGNLIVPSDPRYAWVPMYKRDVDTVTGTASPYAQVIVIGVQNRNRTLYTAAVDATTLPPVPSPPTLQARPVMATFTANMPASPDTIAFAADGTDYTSAVAEGTFVVVANDTSNEAKYAGNANGWVYRVGNPVAPIASPQLTWELAPGNDMYGSIYKPVGAAVHVLVVGRGYTDPTGSPPADLTYSGPSQDIAVYTTFVTVK